MKNLTHLDRRREKRDSPAAAAATAATEARRNGRNAREKTEKEEAGRQARTTGGGNENSAWNRNKQQRREVCTGSLTAGAWFGLENLAIW
jgi:hypothetical protein